MKTCVVEGCGAPAVKPGIELIGDTALEYVAEITAGLCDEHYVSIMLPHKDEDFPAKWEITGLRQARVTE